MDFCLKEKDWYYMEKISRIIHFKIPMSISIPFPFSQISFKVWILIASNPGTMFNPLFIYSHSGLGKTHLLHAVGNYIIKEKKPNAKILYITANDFVEEYIRYVRGEKESQSLKQALNSLWARWQKQSAPEKRTASCSWSLTAPHWFLHVESLQRQLR